MSTAHPTSDIYTEFKHDVNMSTVELERWLKTKESKSVGQDSGNAESIGHQSGEHIIRILHKKKADITPDDEAHMHKVHSYVSRHSAQRPHGDIAHARWRYSLMNWGHDPLK